MRLKALLVVVLSLCGVSTYAQFKASIQGTVMDPQGNAVPGAKGRPRGKGDCHKSGHQP